MRPDAFCSACLMVSVRAISLRAAIRSKRGGVSPTSPCPRPSWPRQLVTRPNMTFTEIPTKNPRETWTIERIEQLKSGFSAGLTCAQIAGEIGVSRNAVIGKMSRLGLSRGRTRAAPGSQSKGSIRRPAVLTQRLLLKALFVSAPIADNVVSAEPCSLLNLAPRKCRWPISAASFDFSFCGNATIDGMSYCAGHARMAYRGSGRVQTPSRAAG